MKPPLRNKLSLKKISFKVLNFKNKIIRSFHFNNTKHLFYDLHSIA